MSIPPAGIDPSRALYRLAAPNSLAAPSPMALIVLLASRKDVMGRFVNSQANRIPGRTSVAVTAGPGPRRSSIR